MPTLLDSKAATITAEPDSPAPLSTRKTGQGSAPTLTGPDTNDRPPKVTRQILFTALGIWLIGLIVLTAGVQRPKGTIFDELYYVPAARAMVHGTLNMDPGEPPMGKLIMAAGISLAGDTPFGWRVAGAMCGSLTLAAVFLWSYLLVGDYKLSMYAAALTLVNNFLFVMSRVAMMDIFLVFFMFFAVLAFTAAIQLELSPAKRRMLLCGSGLLFGFAGACKWNAIDSLLALLVISLLLPLAAKLLRAPQSSSVARFAGNLRQAGILSLLFALVVLPLVSYSSTYWLLYRIVVRQPFGFQDLLRANYTLWHYHVHDGVTLTLLRHWYQWPLLESPMRVLSYLMGNPVVMWGGLAAILYCFARFWRSCAISEVLVVGLYSANWLQWAFTPSRGAYYYYYFPAAMFLGVAVAIALHRLPSKLFGIRLSLIVMAAAAVIFVWCYPRMAHLDSPWDCALGCWN